MGSPIAKQCNGSDASWVSHYCALPSCVFVDHDHHVTTLELCNSRLGARVLTMFLPLVFSTTGGMEMIATVVYKRLASMISEAHGKPYSKTMQWIRCKLSFSLLRSAIMCLCGSRSSCYHPDHHPISGGLIDLACSMGRVPRQDWITYTPLQFF